MMAGACPVMKEKALHLQGFFFVFQIKYIIQVSPIAW